MAYGVCSCASYKYELYTFNGYDWMFWIRIFISFITSISSPENTEQRSDNGVGHLSGQYRISWNFNIATLISGYVWRKEN